MATEYIIDQNVDRGVFALSIFLVVFSYLWISFVPGVARGRVFNAEFMKQFDELHKAETGEEKAPKGGYPDMGCGRFSEKLSYKDWYEFNLAQRVHYNYLE